MKIEIDSFNFIEFEDTPWNDSVLSGRTNEISSFNCSDQNSSERLIKEFDNYCNTNKIIFSSIRINPSEKYQRKSLHLNNYHFVESILHIEKYFPDFDNVIFPLQGRELLLIDAEEEELEIVKQMSYDIFNHGRFHEDPNIPKEISKQRNKNWVESLFYDERIVLLKQDSIIQGFMAYSNKKDLIELLLGGMHPKWSHLAYSFWGSFFIYVSKKTGLSKFKTTISTSNIPILNLYSHFGFNFTGVYFGYHKKRKL